MAKKPGPFSIRNQNRRQPRPQQMMVRKEDCPEVRCEGKVLVAEDEFDGKMVTCDNNQFTPVYLITYMSKIVAGVATYGAEQRFACTKCGTLLPLPQDYKPKNVIDIGGGEGCQTQ
jgi:hypothetical protein